jgi:hypothetical protein
MDDFSSGFSYFGLDRTLVGLMAAVLAGMRHFWVFFRFLLLSLSRKAGQKQAFNNWHLRVCPANSQEVNIAK